MNDIEEIQGLMEEAQENWKAACEKQQWSWAYHLAERIGEYRLQLRELVDE